MKILTLVWSVGLGGTERAAVNYAIGYKKYGCDSRVLVLGEGHERVQDLDEAGVPVTLLDNPSHNSQDVLDAFRRWSPDIIHIHTFSPQLLSFVDQLRGRATKLVETNVFSRPVYSPLYRSVDLSLQLTNWGYWRYTRRMYFARYSPAVSVVPYILDTEKFPVPSVAETAAFRNQLQIPEGAFVAGRIGQPHPSKWDSRLIDIIQQTIAPENSVYYLLVGLPPRLKTAFSEQNEFFRSRIRIIDQLRGDHTLSIYYHSLDCFVHLSKIGESFGYVIAEALQCGTPVLTLLTPLHDNGQFEVVGNGGHKGCYMGIPEIAKGIMELLDRKREQLGVRIITDGEIDQRFSYKAVVPGILEIFQDLINGKCIASNYRPEIVKAFFKFYGKQYWQHCFMARMVNTAFFYRLVRLWKH